LPVVVKSKIFIEKKLTTGSQLPTFRLFFLKA